MSQTENRPEPPSPSADPGGIKLTSPESYEISSQDQALANQIASFDPATDIASPVTIKGDVNVGSTEKLSLNMLPTEVRSTIQSHLSKVPPASREAREQDLIREHLTKKSLEYRIKMSGGDNADIFQRERLSMAKERHDAEGEILRLTEKLAEVIRWEPVLDEIGKPVIDPETGGPKVTAIEVVQGQDRQVLENQIASLERRISELDGSVGDLREKKALFQEVERRKALESQAYEAREIQTRSQERAREERINSAVEQRTKHLRNRL